MFTVVKTVKLKACVKSFFLPSCLQIKENLKISAI